MKRLFFIALIFASVCLTSCLQINELVEIFENGSGELSVTQDIGQLMDMMEAMGGEEYNKASKEKVDSTIMLRDIVDSNKELSVEEKKLIRDGSIHVKMDMEAKQFLINSVFPFSSLSILQEIKNKNADSKLAFSTMENVLEKQQKDAQAGSDENPDLSHLLAVFDYSFSKGLIKRTINKERLRKLEEDPKMAEMKSGAEMGIEVAYNVSYKLPSANIKVKSPNADVSVDGKMVTIKNNLMEVFAQPEKFEFTIAY